MKDYDCRVEYGDVTLAVRFDPAMAVMPPGVNARATSHGPEATIQRPDGVVFHASVGDYFVQIKDQPMIVLNAPSFHALFRERDEPRPKVKK